MKSQTTKNEAASLIDQIAIKLSENMSGYENFYEYRKRMIERINKREPGIRFNPYETVRAETYIDNPIQFIPLNKINDVPPSVVVTKQGLEQFEKMGIEPAPGAFHGVRLGKQVDIPIAVTANDNGTFSIVDGIHRVVQAVVSNNDSILAFVDGGSGPTLEDIFAKVNKK